MSTEYTKKIKAHNEWNKLVKNNAYATHKQPPRYALEKRKQFHKMNACISYMPSEIEKGIVERYKPLSLGSRCTLISYSTSACTISNIDAENMTSDKCFAKRMISEISAETPEKFMTRNNIDPYTTLFYVCIINANIINYSATTSRQLTRFIAEACNINSISINDIRRALIYTDDISNLDNYGEYSHHYMILEPFDKLGFKPLEKIVIFFGFCKKPINNIEWRD